LEKKKRKIFSVDPGMVVCACNSGTWGAEAGRSQVRGQPGLYIARLYLKNNTEIASLPPSLSPSFMQLEMQWRT
jgi:hypothetical protein